MALFDRIVNPDLLIRRMNISTDNVMDESRAAARQPEQLDLFTDYEALEQRRKAEQKALEREHRMQKTLLDIKNKYGKNAILKGLNFEEGATAIERNRQIGGHKA